jgi:hypothetical protein
MIIIRLLLSLFWLQFQIKMTDSLETQLIFSHEIPYQLYPIGVKMMSVFFPSPNNCVQGV